MVEDFLKILRQRCAVTENGKILVCVSGGIDSMVLLDLMKRAAEGSGFTIGIFHAEHGLRGRESLKDAAFVKNAAKDLGLKFHLYKLNLDPETPNLEEAARIRRYEALRACMKKFGYTLAATGHNMDDQAETVLYRLARGSGLRGISAMSYRTGNFAIRPLLGFNRSEIEHYASRNKISFVSDSSNSDIKFKRNLIRHEILPLMKTINPEVIRAIARFSEIAGEDSSFIADAVNTLYAEACRTDWNSYRSFSIDTIRKCHGALIKRFLIQVISEMIDEPRGIDMIQIDAAFDVIKGLKGSHEIKRKLVIASEGGLLVIYLKGAAGFELKPDKSGTYEIPALGKSIGIELKKGLKTAVIRFARPGDRFNGKRITELLSENSIEAERRKFWPVILSGSEIVSVAGMIDSEKIKTKFPL